MNTLRQPELDVGFCILSLDHNFGKFKSTYNSIRRHHPKAQITCFASKKTTGASVLEIKSICPDVYKGKDTMLSLLNEGIKKGHKQWNMFLIEGVIYRQAAFKKYECFLKNEKDVLYPIQVKRNMDGKPETIYSGFLEHESMLNGLLMHQKTFKEVGEFSDNPFDISRLWWAMEAKDKNVNFKAILGTKMC